MKILRIPLAIIFLFALHFGIAAQQLTSDNGIVLFRAGKFEEAANELQRVVESQKKDGRAWMYLGASYVKLNKHNPAVKAFRSARGRVTDPAADYDTPLKIKRKAPAPYTNEARQNLTSGTIRIAVEFRSDGKIGFTFPVEELPFGLTDNAIHAAKAIQFEPAIKDGQPVTVISIIEYSFWIQ